MASPVAGEGAVQTALAWPVERFSSLLEDLSPRVTGIVLLVVGVGLIFIALAFITKTMRTLMLGGIERSLNRVLERGRGVSGNGFGPGGDDGGAELVDHHFDPGPDDGGRCSDFDQRLTDHLGANVGATITGILVSIAVPGPGALIIALVHPCFNVFGILLFTRSHSCGGYRSAWNRVWAISPSGRSVGR